MRSRQSGQHTSRLQMSSEMRKRNESTLSKMPRAIIRHGKPTPKLSPCFSITVKETINRAESSQIKVSEKAATNRID